MKTTLIFTTYNEEKSISGLMNSLKNQSELPDEIVIIDSFSKDKTVEIIKSFNLKNLKIIQKKCNISGGRNEAIRNAKNKYILATDGGCVLHKDWIKEIKTAFKEGDIDYVMGNFKPLSPKTLIGKGIAAVSLQSQKRLSKDLYFASARSMAFKKEVWGKVGGFDESLYTGEDTKFNIQIKEAGFKAVFAKKATLSWAPRESLKKFWKQFRLYGIGDRKARNIFKMPDRFLVVLIYLLFHVFLIGSIFYNAILGWNLIVFGSLLLLDTLRYSKFNILKLLTLWPFVYIKRLGYVIGVLFG